MRLEQLRKQLAALIEKREAERKELLELTNVDKLDDKQEARFKELSPRFKADADGKPEWAEDDQIRSTKAEITQLEAVLAGFGNDHVEKPASPTFKRQQIDPFKDESIMYAPVDQVRGAARTAVEKLPLTDDSIRSQLYATLERADDPSGKLSRHMIAAARPEYRSAFSKLISGQGYSLSPEEVRAVEHVRAASLTDAAGGYSVPVVLDATLLLTGTHDGLTPNVVRQLANVRQISGDNLNLVSTAGVTASWTTEATEATDDAPTLSTLALTPYKAHVTVPYTIEIAMDWVGMEQEMRRLMTVAKDDLEIEAFTTGNGSNRPLGLFYDIYTNYTGQVQASAGSNTFTEPDLYALIQKVAYRYRNRGVWMGNEIIFDKVRQFNVASAGSVWVQLSADRPGTILGRQAYGNPQVDGTYGSGENYVMLYGDIREAYTIVDRVGMVVEPVQHLFGSSNNLPNGMRALYAYWRTGARVVNSGAVAVLNIT